MTSPSACWSNQRGSKWRKEVAVFQFFPPDYLLATQKMSPAITNRLIYLNSIWLSLFVQLIALCSSAFVLLFIYCMFPIDYRLWNGRGLPPRFILWNATWQREAVHTHFSLRDLTWNLPLSRGLPMLFLFVAMELPYEPKELMSPFTMCCLW